MKRHVFLTGEVGSGKSTALLRTLALLNVRAKGLQTYTPEARTADARRLYLRAWGEEAPGTFLTQLPGGDAAHITSAFDAQGCALLEAAQTMGEVIVIDEIGRLEREANAYHAALKCCLDGEKPVLGVIRKWKAPWADWIRCHPQATLIEVTPENRDQVPAIAAALLKENGF